MTLHRLPPRLTVVSAPDASPSPVTTGISYETSVSAADRFRRETSCADPDCAFCNGSGLQAQPYYAEQLQAEPPSTFDKVSDALGSRDCLLVYFGFLGGTFFTLGMAIVWSVL